MVIKAMHVWNFRSLKDEELHCDSLTALVGPNGAGKSSFLRALDLFYATAPKYTPEDFYARDTGQSIRIRLTFCELAVEERQELSGHLQGELLTVEKELSWPPGRQSRGLYGWTRQNPDFGPVRQAAGARARRPEYDKLREAEKYQGLPKWTNEDTALQALSGWEADHLGECEWQRDDGQFFGFKEVGQYHLEEHTRFILIPAVRDAATEAAEAKGSAIYELMELLVRSRLAQRDEIEKLRQEAQQRYDEIVDPSKVPELTTLQGDLTHTLQAFVPDSEVLLTWSQARRLDLPLPNAEVQLVEEEKGYASPVDRAGHGVQRAFILTLLQHLAVAQSAAPPAVSAAEVPPAAEPFLAPSVAPTSPKPNLILAIEEPELYQHPNRQRHMAQVLLALAEGNIRGVADKTQVIYTTHSPLFVDIERFDQVRVLRKEREESDLPKRTRVRHATLDQIAAALEQAFAKAAGSFSGETLRPRLQSIMTPWMNEAFFADVAVLVEGEGDRAAIVSAAEAMDYDLQRDGVSVIPCMGKNNIDRPCAICKALGIPVYVVWDADKGGKSAKPDVNLGLCRLLGRSPEPWPEFICGECACFPVTLTNTLSCEMGADLYETALAEAAVTYGYEKDDAAKSPVVVGEIVRSAASSGRLSPSLEEIVTQIRELRSRSSGTTQEAEAGGAPT